MLADCYDVPKKPLHNRSIYPWSEVGTVQNLYVYPLSSCQPKEYKEIQIGRKGITVSDQIWDNMFVVYNNETGCIYDNSNARLWPIAVNIIEEDILELSLYELKLKLNLKEIRQNEIVKCIQLVAGKHIVKKKYHDCGDDAAEWLCLYLNMNARLGFADQDAPTGKIQDCIQWLYPSADYEELRQICPPLPPSCKVMSDESFNELERNMDEYISVNIFSPNIVITTGTPYKEDQVGWFKIGNAILRTLRPRLRSEKDNTSFYIPEAMRMEVLSLYCETYVPGTVKNGDKVYSIYFEK